MGAYLSSPICDKETIEGSNDYLAFAASSMQGWRMSQEDAHNAILNYDDKTSLFAVYDGHGGAEIALYCSRHLPDFIKQLDSYRQGRLNDALTEGFIQFDALLLEPNVKEILKVLAEEKDKTDHDDDQDDDGDEHKEHAHNIVLPNDPNEENHFPDELNAEEAQILKKEANLPIEEVLKRYEEKPKDHHKHSSSKSDEIRESETKNESTTNKDENSDQKIAEAPTNGDVPVDQEVQPSSSEPKSTTRRVRKSPTSTTATSTAAAAATETGKSKSLTHKLISDNLDELEEDDDDEEDFEFEGSEEEEEEEEEEDEEETSGDEAEDQGSNEEEDEEEEEDDDEDENQSSKTARMKKLMRKSIMAILNRRLKKHKRGQDDEDENEDESEEDLKENQDDGDEHGENDDEEHDEDDDDDDENDADLGKMLDMTNDPGSSSGCTAVVALLRDKELVVANAGDSRCVVCRAGQAIEMSIDHKPEDPTEKNRIEKAGYKVTLDGRVSGGLNLSRAIGDHAYKKTKTLPAEEQAITALPDIRTLTLDENDEFMIIACDGIWNFMSSQDVVDYIRERLEKKSLSQICEELFMHCLAPNTGGDGTGCDNMTAIIVKFNFHRKTNENTEDRSTNERSPWPTMFSSSSHKRSLSPDRTSTDETKDEANNKKAKIVIENGQNPNGEGNGTVTSTDTFSFLTAEKTSNVNSNDSSETPMN